MPFIKIEKNPDGSHSFQNGGTLQKGWAVVPDNITIPDTFPYVNIIVENNIVVSMTEGEKIILPPTTDELRLMREKLCFPYINRGELWYNRLTAEQKTELEAWYQEWLDVTVTLTIPSKPEWLVD